MKHRNAQEVFEEASHRDTVLRKSTTITDLGTVLAFWKGLLLVPVSSWKNVEVGSR